MASTTERMTFSIPAKVKHRARRMHGVNWSAVVTKAIEDKITQLELADRLAARSRLTLEDVDEIADSIDEAMAKHFRARYGARK